MTGRLRQAAKAAFALADRLLTAPEGPRVLTYHQVGQGSGRQIDVDLDDFRRQMHWIAENKIVIDLETALRRWETPLASRFTAITFDDGFRSLYDSAFPLLREMSIPFTVYITTSIIGRSDWEGRGMPLGWPQIEEMAESGLMTVAAHTDTHPDLRSIDPVDITREIEMSDEILRTRLGVVADHFAYPWGYWSEQADDLVRTRYSSAALGSHRILSPAGFDPHLMHRFPVQLSDGLRWFKARLEGGLLLEEETRRKLRGYVGP